MYAALNVFLTSLLYAAVVGGALMISHGSFRRLRLMIIAHRRLRRDGDGNGGKIKEHVAMLLLIAFNGKVSATAFALASILMFTLTLSVGAYNLNPFRAWIMAAISGAAPYVLTRLRAWSVNRRGSQEGERLTAALLNQYRIERHNIYEALEKTVAAGEDFKICKELLFRLLLGIRGTADSVKIKKAADVFAMAVNTNWGRMLAHNISLAAETGVNVSAGLEDVLAQLREARAAMEERKRLNAESTRIVVFFIPALYLGSGFMAVKYMGVPMQSLIRSQLGTEEGFMLFFVILLLFVFNLMLVEAVSSQKMDF
jgi:hypothetical protein